MLDVERIAETPRAYLDSVGTVFATFEPRPDWGNISFGVRVGDERYFVKTAGNPGDPPPGRQGMLWSQRVELLRNAARLWHSCRHPALPRLHRVIESPHGPMLVYQWVDGELVRTSRAVRGDPHSAFQRFHSLPVPCIVRALDVVYEVHDALARSGWIAVDFYGNSLIYDFCAQRLHVIDLDMYRPGPFTNDMGRMYGSSSLMAPEEFELGAPIDQRTNVYTMGRAVCLLLSDGSLKRAAFRGPDAMYDVIRRACRTERNQRFESMAAFYAAWHSVSQSL